MSKIAYIIPGYEEDRTSRKAYEIIASYFKNVDIKPMHVPIKWDLKKPLDFEQYNKQFLKRCANTKADEIYVLGFSFGAVIAFMTAKQVNPSAIILCSLSPYFVEDYKKLKPAWSKWWEANFSSHLSFNSLSQNYSTKTYLIVGDKEHESVIKRAKAAKRKINGSQLKIAKDAKHDIGNKNYSKIIEEVISNL